MNETPRRCVLDASAVLAYLQREPGAEKITKHLDGGLLNAVNLSEVAGKLLEKGLLPAQVVEVIEALGLEVVSFDEDLAHRSALLRKHTRTLGLSLADRACLATAQRLGLPAVTTDQTWVSMKAGIRIEPAR